MKTRRNVSQNSMEPTASISPILAQAYKLVTLVQASAWIIFFQRPLVYLFNLPQLPTKANVKAADAAYNKSLADASASVNLYKYDAMVLYRDYTVEKGKNTRKYINSNLDLAVD